MADKIRLRVWVLGFAPIVLVGAGVAFVYLPGAPSRRPPVAVGPLAASEPEPAPPPSPVAALPPQLPAVNTNLPPSQPAPTMTLSVDPYGSVSGPPPEPIPELDPLVMRPPGSQLWTPEQKAAYKQHVFEEMDARDRSLQKDIAAAQRAGDVETEQRKRLTLAYLRHKRADIERLLSRSPPPPPPADPGDAGS